MVPASFKGVAKGLLRAFKRNALCASVARLPAQRHTTQCVAVAIVTQQERIASIYSFAPICTNMRVFTNPMSHFQGFSPFDKNAIGSSNSCPYHYCSGCGQTQSTGASNDEHSDGVEEGILYSVTKHVSIAGEVAGCGGVGGGVG